METQKQKKKEKKEKTSEKKEGKTENLIESDITGKSKNNCSKTLEGKGEKQQQQKGACWQVLDSSKVDSQIPKSVPRPRKLRNLRRKNSIREMDRERK